MGCAPTKPSRVVNAVASTPELAGKQKFLATPVTSEISHPTTGEAWLLICFAPQSYPGLAIVAKNVSRRDAPHILVKDVTDAQLAVEKEACKITLSWNVFFKALAAELSTPTTVVGHPVGAVCKFTPEGSLELEIRVTLAGTAAGNAKKVDLYRCTLLPVDARPSNVFKYVMTPLAVQFGKKKGDMAEKTDPAVERQLGELEAMYTVKQASLSRSLEHLAEQNPGVHVLRKQTLELQQQDVATQAKLLTAAQILLRGSGGEEPTLGKGELAKQIPTQHRDAVVQLCWINKGVSVAAVKSARDLPLDELRSDAAELRHPVWRAVEEATHNWLLCVELPELLAAKGFGVGTVLAFAACRVCSRHRTHASLTDEQLLGICDDIDALQSAVPEPFYGQSRAVLCLATLLCLFVSADLAHRLSLHDELLFTAMASAASCFLHHDGLPNRYHVMSRTVMASLYPEAPAQRHAAACLAHILKTRGVPNDVCCRSTAATIISAMSFFDAPSTATVALFSQRTFEIKDFGRSRADRILALSALTALSSVAFCFAPMTSPSQWRLLQLQAIATAREFTTLRGLVRPTSVAVDDADTTALSSASPLVEQLVEALQRAFPRIRLSDSDGHQQGLLLFESSTMVLDRSVHS